MPKMAIANTQQFSGRCRARRLLQGLAVLTLLAMSMVLAGCGDDDDFEGADVFELQNTTWSIDDLSAFNLEATPAGPQAGTLEIGTFGGGVLSDDEAPFTLTLAGTNESVTGSVDLDEGDVPVGQDFSRCTFEVDQSSIAPPVPPGLTAGDTNPMDCFVTEDGTLLDLTNRNTGSTSTGTLVVPAPAP